jgi:hypothetical protein
MRATRVRDVLGVLLLAPALAWVAGSQPAAACSCAAPSVDGSQQEAVDTANADAVFVGRTLSRAEVPSPDPTPDDPNDGEVVFTFDVEFVHKGDVTDPVDVTTAANGGLCGADFDVGSSYKVFARRDEDGLVTGLCSGNRLASEADLLPVTATTAVAPATTVPLARTGPSDARVGLAAVALLLVGGGVAVLVVARREDWRHGRGPASGATG